MGISERREREKEERRRTILNSARELILSSGVQQVSMEDIARKAELSKATVYLYFPSKEVLFSEICEESARDFLEHLRPYLQTPMTGVEAIKCIWRGFVELFGNFNEMIIVFQVRNFMNPGLPLVSLEEPSVSTSVDAILDSIKSVIDRCKDEGIFDPNLDSAMATRLLLSTFSVTVENAARIPAEVRKSPIIVEEMKNVFQVIVRGFAKTGIDRTILDIR